MKKTLSSLVGVVVLSLIFVGIVKAQELLEFSDVFSNDKPKSDTSYVEILNDYDVTRGYSDSEIIDGETTNNRIHIVSPTVDKYEKEPAEEYALFVSPYRVSQIKSGDPKVDISKIIMKRVRIASLTDERIEFEFDSSELDFDKSYYGFIVPIDSWDGLGVPSSEICFNASSNLYNQGEGCDTFSLLAKNKDETNKTGNLTELHGSACVGMDLANIHHVSDGKTLTLEWTAVDGDTVEIAIFDPKEEVYKSLGTVKMSDEKFDYELQWNGVQNFMVTNGCKDVYYKADAAIKEGEKTEEKEKIVPAATGPAENILYIAIAAVVIYGAYVLFFRKSSEN